MWLWLGRSPAPGVVAAGWHSPAEHGLCPDHFAHGRQSTPPTRPPAHGCTWQALLLLNLSSVTCTLPPPGGRLCTASFQMSGR